MKTRTHRRSGPGSQTMAPLLPEDVKDMAAYFRKRSARNHALFQMMLYTGRRINDVLSLDVWDVTSRDRRNRLVIRKRIEFREAKSGKFTSIKTHSALVRSLSRYLQERERKGGKKLTGSEPLFPSRKARLNGEYRLTRRQAWQIFTDAAESLGFPRSPGTHGLRKTFGMNLHRDAGASIEDIQSIFRHSSTRVTKIYIGLSQERLDEFVSALPSYT